MVRNLGKAVTGAAQGLLLIGCTTPTARVPAVDAAPPAATPAPLVERVKFFGNPAATQGRISPDGQWLSWLAPNAGVMNIWVAPAADPAKARTLTSERGRPIRQYWWAPDSRKLVFANDRAGDEKFALYAVDIATGAQRSLTPTEGTRASVVAISPSVPSRILVGLSNRDPRRSDIYSLNLDSGALDLVFRNERFAGFLADNRLRLRMAQESLADGSFAIYRIRDGIPEKRPFETIPFEDNRTTGPFRLSRDGRTVFWLDSRGRDTAALIAQDIESGVRTVLGEDSRADVSATLVDPETGSIDAYAVNYLGTEWRPLTAGMKDDLAYLESHLHGELQIVSRSDDDGKWIVNVDPVTGPATAYLYERARRTLARIYVVQSELAGAALARVHPTRIRARDGLTLVSYLTLPPGSDADGDGRPDVPLPMVLLVHGGPWLRDNYGYNPRAQWLANRGYAVLAANFRGSVGFGKSFISAGNEQWGRAMHDDLLDAVDWAVASGITAADRVAIMGHSYGGYAVLAALTFTPDRFACGVDTAGSSNLETLLAATPPMWEAEKAQLFRRMGDPNTAAGRASLRDRSPLHKANQIRRPLLIGQGANDPRVPRAEADQIVRAMRANGLPVTYVVFPDEGHNLVRPENSVAFYAVAEQFLARCLGGRAEPFGDALRRTAMVVEAEGPLTPGLRELLASRPSASPPPNRPLP